MEHRAGDSHCDDGDELAAKPQAAPAAGTAQPAGDRPYNATKRSMRGVK